MAITVLDMGAMVVNHEMGKLLSLLFFQGQSSFICATKLSASWTPLVPPIYKKKGSASLDYKHCLFSPAWPTRCFQTWREVVNTGSRGSSWSLWCDGFLWGSFARIWFHIYLCQWPMKVQLDLTMIYAWFDSHAIRKRCTWINNITREINHKRWLNRGGCIDLSIALRQHYSLNTQ